MQTSISDPSSGVVFKAGELAGWLKMRGAMEGFDKTGIARPDAVVLAASRLTELLDAGYHGGMTWMADNRDRRCDPRVLWPEVRSVIVLAMNYGPGKNPLHALAHKSNAAISVHAQGADYHGIIKGKLKRIAGGLARRSGAEVKVFVDTAPLMEKPLAQAAGIGWQGKHTNLVARDFGSWLFLGAILTAAELPMDTPEQDHCGGCTRCLDICPTKAFPAPYKLDARRCISYLTIEHKEQIPLEFRTAIGNRIYGCDDCLAVCPWNKFARASAEIRFSPRLQSANPPLADLIELDDPAFRARFSGSPIKRIGRDRFVRNAVLAAGNSGNPALIPKVLERLRDTSALVRGMAVWAATVLMANDLQTLSRIRTIHLADERDTQVRDEWEPETAP